MKTKRSFRQDSAKRRIATVLVYLALAVCAVALFRGVIGSLGDRAVETVIGVRNFFAYSTAALPTYVRGRAELQKEIDSLHENIAAESGNQATIARLMHENEELRSLLGDSSDERVLAGVIARPPFTPYDVLMIDRGSEHGISEGALVYQAHAHAIGVVSKVFSRTSLVTLFSSSGIETTVYVYGPDVFAYAYGEGGGVIRISLPQGIEVKEGDAVVLPSLHMGDLGVVERVVSLPTQPEQNAYVTFPVPIQSLRTVVVGKEVAPTPSKEDLMAGVERFRAQFHVEVPDELRMGTGTTTSVTHGTTTGTTSP